MPYDYPDLENEPHDHCRDGAFILSRAMLASEPSFRYLGCYNPRPIRNSDKPSLHWVGRAIDIGVDTMSPQSKRAMDEIVIDLVAHLGDIVIQQIIWYRRVWTTGIGWRAFDGGSGPHTDHAHIELNQWGADNPDLWVPQHWFDHLQPEEEEMTPEDYKGIADAIMNSEIHTTYDVGTSAQHEVTVTLRDIIGNIQIIGDRIVNGVTSPPS